MHTAQWTEPSVIDFLHQFERLAEREDFDLIQHLIHDQAVLRFNDGDFIGKPAVRAAFEKTWAGSPGLAKTRFYLSDIQVMHVDPASASATYTYHWQAHMGEQSFHIQGRGTRVLVRHLGHGQIMHEHLSRWPAPAKP